MVTRYCAILFALLLISCNKEEKTDVAARNMQKMVQEIAAYTKAINPNFVVIPQNGIQLSYINGRPENELNVDYLASIDGFGVEELFFDGNKYKPDTYRLNMLGILKNYHPIFVSDFVKDNSKMQEAVDKCAENGFKSYPRSSSNYYYQEIASILANENNQDITNLSQAQNFLYLISTDNYSTKEDYLNAIRNTNFDMVLIDLFYNDLQLTAQEVQTLKTKANGAKRLVIAYMNIGSAEKYRYYWQKNWRQHSPKWLKKKYPGYKDELYVEFWNQEWKDIIYGNDNSYAKRILNADFDGVYLDNVEAFYVLYHSS